VGDVNDFAGAVGGTILTLELIVLLVLLVAINGGLAFGLWWLLKRRNWLHGKVAGVTARVEKVVDKGANISAAPVIRTASVWQGLKAGLHRATHWPRTAQLPEGLPRPAVAPGRDRAA
jgi:hypothetical protein